MSELKLVSYPDIREILNTDDTDESMVTLLSFSVTTEIEKFTNRVFSQRSLIEYHDGFNNSSFTLKEYPVSLINSLMIKNTTLSEYQLISPELYSVSPEPGETENPVEICLPESYLFPRGKRNIKVTYTAGYTQENLPSDLKMAFCEILSWMLKRLKARQIGVNSLIRNKNQTAQPLYDVSFPEHAREILHSYRRKDY